ncbi:MAG: PTS galactosamine transporter subunit IIB, partial [Erysipelotrichaceae bacterium]
KWRVDNSWHAICYCMSENGGGMMAGPNILLTRIDNRLVHGQVGVTWTKTLGANLIIVADDIVASEPLQQSLMQVTAKSSGAGIRFFTVKHTAEIIGNAAPEQKIFIICRTPKEVRQLVELGVDLKEVNVGNMHFSEGKKPITKKVYVSDQDMEDLKFISNKGIKVYAQDIPGDSILKI